MIVAVAVVGVYAFSANDAAASTCAFTTTLKVGSRGAEVTCLQTALGVSPATGYFGSITKAAVVAWQASKGLVADGVFGPKSQAVFATGTVAGNYPAGCTSSAGYSSTTGLPCSGAGSYPAGCTSSVGYSSTTGQPCSGATSYPAGCTSTSGYSTTTGQSCSGTVTTSTGEGSISVTYDATPANNLAVNKGETKDVIGFKVKAVGSDMKVSRLWLDLNTRIWLSASNASLYDGSTLLESVDLSSSTVLETSIGSAWQLQFNNINVTVPAGTTKVLTLKVTRPTLTNSSAASTVATTSTFRATDTAGLTNTYTLPSTRTINLSSSSNAAAGTLTATLGSSSPLAQSISGLSTTSGNLTAVKLMDFDLKATDGPINVSHISGTLTVDAGTCAIAECVASAELRDGSNVLSSVTGAATFAFDNLNIDIAAGTTKTLSVYAKVNHVATSYVVAGDGIHAVVNDVDGTTNSFATAADITPTVTGNVMYLYQYAPSVALGATTATTTNTTGSISADFSLAFAVTAPSGHDIYVHKTISATEGNSNVVAEKTDSGNGGTIAVTMSASSTSGTDGSTYYIVPAGQTRTFTSYGHTPTGGSAGYTGMKLYKVYWALDDSGTGAQAQTWGLQDFKTAKVYVTAS